MTPSPSDVDIISGSSPVGRAVGKRKIAAIQSALDPDTFKALAGFGLAGCSQFGRFAVNNRVTKAPSCYIAVLASFQEMPCNLLQGPHYRLWAFSEWGRSVQCRRLRWFESREWGWTVAAAAALWAGCRGPNILHFECLKSLYWPI